MENSAKIEDIKSRVKKSYEEAESTDFLRKCVEIQKENLAKDYAKYRPLKISPDFQKYKTLKTQYLNFETTNSTELAQIGIFLIALEEFTPDEEV